MAERILSISGLRGVVGDGLDPEYVTRFSASLGTMFEGGLVVISRDGRSTGEMLRHAILSGLLATGCKVIDLGIASTPTCGVMVTALGAAGGLQLTASHNPIEWNGLKPFSPLGSVFDKALGEWRTRMDHYLKHRLYPVLPPWEAMCFYPMSKLLRCITKKYTPT